MKKFEKLQKGRTMIKHNSDETCNDDEVYYYESSNVGHVFSSRADFKSAFKMVQDETIEIKDPEDPKFVSKTPFGPDFINIHTKQFAKEPIKWIECDGLTFPETINFFFCIKHENGGKIQSH